MNNFAIFVEMLKNNPEFTNLLINKETISYEGKTVDFSNFDFQDFYAKNNRFNEEITTLKADALIGILDLHAKYYNELQQENDVDEKQFTKIAQDYPVLRSFHLIHNYQRIENVIKNYVHYQDKFGVNHLISDISLDELLKYYNNLVTMKGTYVTEDELYSYLCQQKKQMSLECLNDALMRDNASEEHLNNLKLLNERNHATGDTLDTPLGNEEEKIYVSHGMVTTFNLDKNNKYVKENHEASSNGTMSEVVENTPMEDYIEEKEKIPLITFEEYEKLILKPDKYTKDEHNKIKVFENYLFDVITYKDYLIPEVYQCYVKYCQLSNYLYSLKNPNDNIIDAKKRYENMLDRSENITLTNVQDKVLKLVRTNPKLDNIGFASIVIYIVILLIVIGILIAVFLLLK